MTKPEVLSPPLVPARALCFAPHPDDEVLGPGATLHLHARSGGEVAVVVATDGDAGDPQGRFPEPTYAARRREESRRALATLGLPGPTFWGLPDSCEVVEADKLRLIALVAAAVAEFAPDLVYLPWEGDDNRDHLVLHEVVVRGLREGDFTGGARGYEVWAPISSPEIVVDITAVLPQKQRALACYESQLAYGDLGHQVSGLNAYRSLLLEKSGGSGEAFQRIVI